MKNKFSLLFLIGFLIFSCRSQEPKKTLEPKKISALESNFKNPSDDNTIWCYWYWIGDDISKDGITKDLEAMKAAGIGGAFIGNINPEEKDGKVPILSEEWWEHMVHAVKEGKRIGVDIGAFNSPGWSQSGGPWVEPDMAMRYLTYSEVKVNGGKKINLDLVKPTDEFQDVYVLAFPSISSEEQFLSSENSTLKVTPDLSDKNRLIDVDTTETVGFSKQHQKYNLEFTSKEPIIARSLKIIPGKKPIEIIGKISAKQNNIWNEIKSFRINRSKLDPNVGPDKYAPIMIALPETTSDKFKVEFEVPDNLYESFTEKDPVIDTWDLAEIIISEAAGLDSFAEKDLSKMHPTPFPAWDSYLWKPQNPVNDESLIVDEKNVIDISDFMDATGHLSWNAPKGNWTIQRFGMTPTGTKNAPAAPQGKGYEIDKMNKELAKFHYDQYIGEFLKRIPEESKSALKYVIADSYEMGSQNWTDGFKETFEKKYGYNPKKYLPVFSGRIVGSVEESNRFLWDLRRLVADAVAYQYVGGLKEASNEDNLKLWLENYGHWGFPSEFLMYGGQSDMVSGEFWNEGTLGDIECKSASSAAHIYGKTRVSAEAFTASNRTYVRHPALLKKRGDWAFTEGINHFVLHLYIHQPDDNRVPGVNAWFSTEFNRHNTWFQKSKSYFDYLRRSQYLLQQGTYAADVCYFIGENAPIMTGVRQPELPKGYSYDYINAEVILNRLSVKDGKLVLPDGMSYSLLVLPPFETMRPELLTKIEELVSQGGKIYGQAPERSPSLQNYPESDKQVKMLSEKMWAGNSQFKKYGKGAIIDGLSLEETLDRLHIKKDVILDANDPVLWTHRKLQDKDIYFLTNQSDKTIHITPSFRVENRKPELWDAVTGEVRPLPDYSQKEGSITVPLKMEALQSWFIVFSNSKEKEQPVYNTNFPELTTIQTIESSWQVDFQNKEIGPKDPVKFSKLQDWITNENEKIKYYSGTASYSSTFQYNKEINGNPVFIDLGKVGVMASVKINGIDLGTTWIAPHKLEITDALKPGENTIEIEVVNVWRNRITGDKKLPEEERTTWLLVDNITPEEALIPSGLLGPVTIQTYVKPVTKKYSDGRPETTLRMDARDHGIILKYGDGPNKCDMLGARDAWVFKAKDTYYMHYDAAGPKGWLSSLAVSKDLLNWEKKGPILDFGKPGEDDSESAAYGVTYLDGDQWHMFYLGTPNVSEAPDLVPMFPYLTLKAKANSPKGPWIKQKHVVPFRIKSGTYYSITASPGQIVKNGDEYLQFFSATTKKSESPYVQRTLGIARTKNLDSSWTIDSEPILPVEEQIENSTLYYEESINTWFLFTNHIGIEEGTEFTDAIWVYWSKDLNKWDSKNKAVVLDGSNCSWSNKCIGLPSVVPLGNQLAIFYDSPGGESISHMKRSVGLAWLDLPLSPPIKNHD